MQQNFKTKISVIGTVGLPASYGGFETLAERLIEETSLSFTVYCSKNHYVDRPIEYKGADLVYIPFNANGAMSIIYDIVSMMHALISGHKNFLVLGVSGAIFFPILRLFPKLKIITNIDGIEWKREKWNLLAKYFLKFSEFLAVKYSTHVVSDNDAISEYIYKNYHSSCYTIAYGGDHALKSTSTLNLHENLNINSPFALSICRIEPENNISLILEAFSKASLNIVFIGNWENSTYGMQLYNKYKDAVNITLLMPIYCLETLYAYRSSCSVYIHGHSAGGTNPSLIEIMHFSKPIAAFDCSFNRHTMENKGNYFKSSDDLLKLLNKQEFFTNGDDMVEIAKRRYTWDIVRKQYLELFTSQ